MNLAQRKKGRLIVGKQKTGDQTPRSDRQMQFSKKKQEFKWEVMSCGGVNEDQLNIYRWKGFL